MLPVDSNTIFNIPSRFGSIAAASNLNEGMKSDPEYTVYTVALGQVICETHFLPHWDRTRTETKKYLVTISPEGSDETEDVWVYGKITNGFYWAYPTTEMEYIQRAIFDENGIPILQYDRIVNVQEFVFPRRSHALVNAPVGILINGIPTKTLQQVS